MKSHFAESLKTLRQDAGYTMQTLADKAYVSKSMISKIERDDVQPTIDVAARLAKALGKTLSEMLHATQATQVVFLSKDEQAVWEDAHHVKRRNISPVFEGLKIEWLHVTLPSGAMIHKSKTLHPQTAEKFVLVTKGTLQVKVDQQIYKMKKGDSLYFDASAEHNFANQQKEIVEFYIVIKH